jgi:hypothetical protein
MRKQADELKSGDTLIVYVGGHGVPGGFRIKNENGDIQSQELRDELKEFDPGVDVIVILQGCNTGEWLKDLEDVANLTITSTDKNKESYGDFDFFFLLSGGLLSNIDLNPNDEGSEYTSSLVARWEEALGDPDLLDEIKQRAKDEGISFIQALISEAHKRSYWLNISARLKLANPQISPGSNKGRQKTPEDSTDSTDTTPDTPSGESAPDTSGESSQACAVFEQVEIVDTVMRHMRDCNPTLNFYYKLDTPVPGLASASPIPVDYSVSVNGKEGDCFLEDGFDDRLYCRVEITPAEANNLGHFQLYANPCQEPILVLDLTIPQLEGCGDGEPQTESEGSECDSEE